ncbi:hypothetical protein HPOK113_0089 [Helicobacter pylori OK113]|nr:hypothetical protein HPOK113_0089 [Helicobacter pylori OK113]
MKKSFKKLGFVSLATSSVLLGSMNATNLETYAALQKLSHVFGNYVAKTNNNKKSVLKDGKESGNSGDQASQQQAQTTASSGNQIQKPHQLKRDQVQAVAVAHQVQAVAVWQAS